MRRWGKPLNSGKQELDSAFIKLAQGGSEFLMEMKDLSKASMQNVPTFRVIPTVPDSSTSEMIWLWIVMLILTPLWSSYLEVQRLHETSNKRNTDVIIMLSHYFL